jgi:hypothetical protein
VSPASFPIAFRTSALTGSLCVPSPIAMKELRNGSPSIVPRTFTSPRVPKTSTDRGQTTYVHPPLAGLFWSVASNCSGIALLLSTFRRPGTRQLIGKHYKVLVDMTKTKC